MKNTTRKAGIILLLLGLLCRVSAQPITTNPTEENRVAYLFAYFLGGGEGMEQVCFAVSPDGYNYKALNGGKPVIDSKTVSETGGLRDPHILRTEDGKSFYMVVTDMVAANGWDSNRGMVLMKSDNLVDWTSSIVNIQKKYPGQEDLKRVWAPQTIYDSQEGKYLVYWSMKHGEGPDIIYYAYANDDFTDLVGEPKPFFVPRNGKSCIDGDIIYKNGIYHLFYKTEGHGDGIKKAMTDNLTAGRWIEQPDYKQQTRDAVEGSCIFKLIGEDKYILLYDVYKRRKYQFCESTDLDSFRAIDQEISMDFHPRHGTVIAITQEELDAVTRKWGQAGASSPVTNTLVIDTKKPIAEIQPTMYGLFFEDINYGADGGLYAELVKNRSFEFPQNLMGWKSFGNVELREDGPFERNPHYVRLSNPGHKHKRTGLENEGFLGIGVKEGEEYRFSVWARTTENSSSKLRVELIKSNTSADRQALAAQDLVVDSKEWKKYQVVLKPRDTESHAALRIFLASSNGVDLEHVSLFPVDTWNGHENGMRKDLMQDLYDIRPGLFRFPGGCIVEGTDLDTRYDWKKSVGPVENRPLNENRWHYTFQHRFFPDYFQSYGLGYYEYFLLSEELGAEPLPVVNCGLSCQYQNDHPDSHVCLDDMSTYIQDALDLIEFANGDQSTVWGKVRADMGHPAPFNLKFIGIGNEQWGPEYPERLELFIRAIRKVYPDILIVGSSGPASEGDKFDYLWPEMKRLKVDLVDEHFYRPEDWFLSQGARYDNYDRKGPKVFAGEYACHGKGRKYNHFHASLLEAAFMTGMERNADIVHMATYAPLFAHVDGWQWRPDMIWFDNLRSVRTVSYYVQQLFSLNKGTHVLSLKMDKQAVTGAEGQNGLFATASWDKETGDYIIKVVNTSDTVQPIALDFTGLKKKETLVGTSAIFLHSDDLYSDNTLENPTAIVPREEPLSFEGTTFIAQLPPHTFAIYKFTKK